MRCKGKTRPRLEGLLAYPERAKDPRQRYTAGSQKGAQASRTSPSGNTADKSGSGTQTSSISQAVDSVDLSGKWN